MDKRSYKRSLSQLSTIEIDKHYFERKSHFKEELQSLKKKPLSKKQ